MIARPTEADDAGALTVLINEIRATIRADNVLGFVGYASEPEFRPQVGRIPKRFNL